MHQFYQYTLTLQPCAGYLDHLFLKNETQEENNQVL